MGTASTPQIAYKSVQFGCACGSNEDIQLPAAYPRTIPPTMTVALADMVAPRICGGQILAM
jgi:hypothetical protein